MEQINIIQQQERSANGADHSITERSELSALDAIIVYRGATVTRRTDAPMQPTTLKKIIEEIRSSGQLAAEVQKVRAVENKDERNVIKKRQLPYITLAKFKHNYLNKDNYENGKHPVFDLDDLNGKLETVRKDLESDPTTFMVFISPGGNGLKLICEFDEEITDGEEYRSLYKYYAGKIEDTYGIKVDPRTHDPSRACFLSYDPTAFVNINRVFLSTKVVNTGLNHKKRRAKKASDFAFSGATQGSRDESATSMIGKFIEMGHDQDFVIELMKLWNLRNSPPMDEQELIRKVEEQFKRWDTKYRHLPTTFKIHNNCYIKKNAKGHNTISTFIIRPKELLELDDSDCLKCDVISHDGTEYKDVLIENTDWHSKSKLLKAIGHQDCSFTGEDRDVQALCGFVNVDVPLRKKGTKVVGIIDKTWVANSMNINASGIVSDPTIIPYEKGGDAFYKQIKYSESSPNENRVLVSGLCEDLFQINTPEVVIPILGWMFAAPMKPLIMEQTGSFPILFLHGTQGGGKTSTASLFMRMNGYKFVTPKKCDMKPFPLLKLLSSTNAIPVVLDEFKVADIKEDIFQNLLRTLRESYNGEVESKGHQDQTVQDYKLDAPIVLAGEWSINQPAIKERIILVRFTDVVKKKKPMQEAFERLKRMNLESFIPAYISFCLNQNITAMYEDSKIKVDTHFKSRTIAPRIIHNLSVMVLGLDLFQAYAASLGLNVPDIALDKILDSQLEEITGNKSGFVRSAVDQMVEELGAMVQKNEKEQNLESSYKPTLIDVPWYKKAQVDKKDVLAINFTRIFPEFKEHCRRTKYEGDLLDKESYLKMFDECSYIVKKNHPVNYGNGIKSIRSLCIDIAMAKEAGLDLDGFGIN